MFKTWEKVVAIVGCLLIIGIFTNGLIAKKDDKVIPHNYIFYGQSDNWIASIVVNAQQVIKYKDGVLDYSVDNDTVFTLTYTGRGDLQTAEEFHYTYECNRSKSGLTTEYPRKNYFIRTDSNHHIHNPWEIIKVTVGVDGVIETFDLSYLDINIIG